MENGSGLCENAIEYEIVDLSKFMTIYAYCILDAMGVHHARAVQGRSTNCHILITSVCIKRFRQVISVSFFLFSFPSFTSLSLFLHSYFFDIGSKSVNIFQVFISRCIIIFLSVSINIFHTWTYRCMYKKINFYYLSLKQNAIYEIAIYYERVQYWFVAGGCNARIISATTSLTISEDELRTWSSGA